MMGAVKTTRASGAGRPNHELLVAGTVLAMLVALYLVLVWVPNERTMGIVSRIFYFHVASAWNAFLAFFVVLVASIAYLWRRRLPWDVLAGASAEVGVLFTTMALVSGTLWMRPVWNVWWTWDPRLTTTTVLWFLYAGYLVLRGAVEGEDRRARLSAVFGIVAFVDVPIVFLSIRWWRTIHPQVLAPGDIRLAPEMLVTLLVSVGAFTLLYALLCAMSYRVGKARLELDRTKARLHFG